MKFKFIVAITMFASLQSSWSAFVFFDPEVSAQVPVTISALGMYDNITSKQISTDLVFYDVQAPYWVDGVHKMRWVALKWNFST